MTQEPPSTLVYSHLIITHTSRQKTVLVQNNLKHHFPWKQGMNDNIAKTGQQWAGSLYLVCKGMLQ